MKEFIDKLISRLEEKIFVAELYGFGWEGQRVGNLLCLGDVKDISEQLAEEYKGGWIPCSVELPKYMERAITCDEKGNIHVFPCDGKYFLDECCKRITENHERYYVPIAWMPLPKPYQKEGE